MPLPAPVLTDARSSGCVLKFSCCSSKTRSWPSLPCCCPVATRVIVLCIKQKCCFTTILLLTGCQQHEEEVVSFEGNQK